MNVSNFINIIPVIKEIKNNSGEFVKPEFDSRKINKGDLFVAVKGETTDGHKYIDETIKKGASVIVCENLPQNPDKDITWLQVKSSSASLGIISSFYYDNPSGKISLVGITGTNGKTTIAISLYKLITEFGYKCGLISTNKIMINNTEINAAYTTPDSLQINKLLYEMLEAGCEYCFMEVSSHAVVQNRISGLHFSGGVFTNLSHDHLDYHKDFEEYLNAKKKFFDNLPDTAFALINTDDRNGKVMIQNSEAQKFSYSLKSNSDYKASIIEKHFNGMLLKIDNSEVWTKFIGNFNAYNLLAVYATAIKLGFEKSEILIAISKLDMVDGRFEAVVSKNNIMAIIDYAHTPDALENILKTINELKQGKIFTVVGCGGDRDKTKRPIMAKIAVEYSDKVILTSDNPRSENPGKIIDDMKRGVDNINIKKTLIISDRKEAIRTACMMADENDIILIAGKGHEKYQEISGVKHKFDDKDIVCKTFNEL